MGGPPLPSALSFGTSGAMRQAIRGDEAGNQEGEHPETLTGQGGEAEGGGHRTTGMQYPIANGRRQFSEV